MNIKDSLDYLRALSNSLPFDFWIHDFVSIPPRVGYLIDWILSPLGFINSVILSVKEAIRPTSANNVNRLSICSIVKNECPYIKEFIEFHCHLGIDHFYIYDNESEDCLRELLGPYIDSGVVDYRVIRGAGRQLDAYNDLIRRTRHTNELIAFIDIDEFLVPNNKFKTVREAVEHWFNDFPADGYGINWRVFGSSGYKTVSDRPSAYVTQSFLYRAPDEFSGNRHIKCIVNPSKVLSFINPHLPVLLPSAIIVDSHGDKIRRPQIDASYDYLSLHHYFCKSYEEFQRKRNRGKADLRELRPMSDFAEHDRNDVFDSSALTLFDK